MLAETLLIIEDLIGSPGLVVCSEISNLLFRSGMILMIQDLLVNGVYFYEQKLSNFQ